MKRELPGGPLAEGNVIQLRRRNPPPEMDGLTLVGIIEAVAGPLFYVLPMDGTPPAFAFRADENQELAVRLAEGSVWEILRVMTRAQFEGLN